MPLFHRISWNRSFSDTRKALYRGHQAGYRKVRVRHGGTLFLDEIGDLSPDAQAKLLRALQERKVQRVGGNEEIPVDARFICATNQNLQERVEKGLFRQDLYFRINVFPLLTPPLRERKEDIPTLARHFLERFDRGQGIQLSDGAVRVLMEYPGRETSASWPT